MSWLDKPAEVDAAVQLPSFTLNDIERNDCSQNYTGGNVIFKLELQKFWIDLYCHVNKRNTLSQKLQGTLSLVIHETLMTRLADIHTNWTKNSIITKQIYSNYYPFKEYVEYIFSPGGVRMMSHTILRFWLAALTKHDVMLWLLLYIMPGTTKICRTVH